MYFKEFPDLYYNFKINGVDVLKIVKDITQNVRVRKALLEGITLYDTYNIQEGETPEIIAHKFYGTPELHWVIMLVNERYDYLNDFPLSYLQFESHIADQYNVFEALSWTNSGTDITVPITAHGIAASELPLEVTVSDAWTTTTTVLTGATATALESGINGTQSITAVTDDTITFSSTYSDTNKVGAGGLLITSSEREYRVKEYYLGDYVVDSDEVGASSRTYYDWEVNKNEEKRTIKLVHPSLINNLVSQLKNLI